MNGRAINNVCITFFSGGCPVNVDHTSVFKWLRNPIHAIFFGVFTIKLSLNNEYKNIAGRSNSNQSGRQKSSQNQCR